MTSASFHAIDYKIMANDWPALQIINPCPTMTANEYSAKRNNTSGFPNNITKMQISLRHLAISLMGEMHGMTEAEFVAYKKIISKGFEPIGINFMDLL